jgi:hypothetical protein
MSGMIQCPNEYAHEQSNDRESLASRCRRADLRRPGDFSRIHALPQSGQDVPDDLYARLVVLRVDAPYSKEAGNAAELAAKAILETRGNTPRLYRNTLVFLAADKIRLQDLDEAVRCYLAWESILKEQKALNLDPNQVTQAEAQKASIDGAIAARLPETYQWGDRQIDSSPNSPGRRRTRFPIASACLSYTKTTQDASSISKNHSRFMYPVFSGTQRGFQ